MIGFIPERVIGFTGMRTLIRQLKQEAMGYKTYLTRIVALAKQVQQPEDERYPFTINGPARRALYDNLKDVPGLDDLILKDTSVPTIIRIKSIG